MQRDHPTLVLPPLQGDLGRAVAQLLGRRALPSAANPGLVFDRYAKLWLNNRGLPEPAKSEQRTEWLSEFVRDYASRQASGAPELARRIARLDTLADEHRDYRTVSPLVTGMGADHPLENGFSFEHNLGLPVLPGSSVKGLVRAGARALGSDNKVVTRLLGSEAPGRRKREHRNAPTSPGLVNFLDAWPTRWPDLEVDLINPHHPHYTDDQGNPIDPKHSERRRSRVADLTEEPKPVSFLVVAPGTPYRFAVRWSQRDVNPLTRADKDLVWKWLTVGLTFLGIGAKTGVGYGHMQSLTRPAAPTPSWPR